MVKYKFDDIAINSILKKKPTEEDKYTYIGLEHLDSGSLKVVRYGSEVAPKGEKLLMKKGDVLFGKRRAYQKKVGIAPFDGIFSAHGMVLRPKENVIDKDFFPLFISSDYFLDAAIKISVGSLSPTINWKDLKELEFELPSMEKQRELAQILWAAEETKQAYKNLLQKTDDLVKAKFEEIMVKNVRKSQIENICKVFIDGDWIENKDQSENGIRLIQTGNIGTGYYIDKGERARFINQNTFKRLNCSEVFPGDILVSRLPDPIGRACIIPSSVGRAVTAVDCTIIRLKKDILPEFFIGFTLSDIYKAQINLYETGSTRKRISRKNLGSITIPLPSLDEQLNFVKFIQQAEQSKQQLQTSLDSLNATMRALINENLK